MGLRRRPSCEQDLSLLQCLENYLDSSISFNINSKGNQSSKVAMPNATQRMQHPTSNMRTEPKGTKS
jgi:hypothetical protein